MTEKKKIEFLENKVKGYENWLKRKNADIDALKEKNEELYKAFIGINNLVESICISLAWQFGDKGELILDLPKAEDLAKYKASCHKNNDGKAVITVKKRETAK